MAEQPPRLTMADSTPDVGFDRSGPPDRAAEDRAPFQLRGALRRSDVRHPHAARVLEARRGRHVRTGAPASGPRRPVCAGGGHMGAFGGGGGSSPQAKTPSRESAKRGPNETTGRCACTRALASQRRRSEISSRRARGAGLQAERRGRKLPAIPTEEPGVALRADRHQAPGPPSARDPRKPNRAGRRRCRYPSPSRPGTRWRGRRWLISLTRCFVAADAE